jgi:hypothetical protein
VVLITHTILALRSRKSRAIPLLPLFAFEACYRVNVTLYIYIYIILTYILTPWSRVLQKLAGLKPVKKLRAFYGNRMFITAFISVRHLSVSLASST